MKRKYQVLKKLSSIHAPSGDEAQMTDFILEYVNVHAQKWKVVPKLFYGEGFQNNVVLVFGKPKTAVFVHMDSIGFTVRYENQLVPIGSPEVQNGYPLKGTDSRGPIECVLSHDDEGHVFYDFGRPIDRGTNLVWNSEFRESEEYIEAPYMDNRLGVFTMLEVCKTLENGIIVFSTWEEHGGGSVPFLIDFLFNKYSITQTLVADITWITDGVIPGDGVVVSMRDRNIPRREYLNKIISLAEKSGIPYQLEVEGGGSSDGREIHQSPFPIDWLFIGAAEQNVHSPNEKVHKKDIEAMIALYSYLLKEL